MKITSQYFRFVADSLLNGISLLLVITPASATRLESESQSMPTGIDQHFIQVGAYMRSAIAKEESQLLANCGEQEKKQLELGLPI